MRVADPTPTAAVAARRPFSLPGWVGRAARELLPFVPVWVAAAVLSPGALGQIGLDLLGFALYFAVHGRAFLGRWLRSAAGLVYPSLYLLFAAAHAADPAQVRPAAPLDGLPPLYYGCVVLLSAWAIAWSVLRADPERVDESLAGRILRKFARGLFLLVALDCLVVVGLVGVLAFADVLTESEALLVAATNVTFLMAAWFLRVAARSAAAGGPPRPRLIRLSPP